MVIAEAVQEKLGILPQLILFTTDCGSYRNAGRNGFDILLYETIANGNIVCSRFIDTSPSLYILHWSFYNKRLHRQTVPE